MHSERITVCMISHACSVVKRASYCETWLVFAVLRDNFDQIKPKPSYLFISIKVNKYPFNLQLIINPLKVAGWLRNTETSINACLCLSALWCCSLSGASRFTCRTGLRKAAVTVGWGTMSPWAVSRSSHTLSLWCRRRTTSTSRPLRTRGPKQTETQTPTLVSVCWKMCSLNWTQREELIQDEHRRR